MVSVGIGWRCGTYRSRIDRRRNSYIGGEVGFRITLCDLEYDDCVERFPSTEASLH